MAAGNEQMNMSSVNRAGSKWKEYSSVINGIMLVLGFASMFLYLGSYKTTIEKGIEENQANIAALSKDQSDRWEVHMQLHKDRLAEVKEREGATGARIQGVEKAAAENSRQNDNLVYRVTVLEQKSDAVTKTVNEIQAALQQLASDQRVSTEILKRLDSQISDRKSR